MQTMLADFKRLLPLTVSLSHHSPHTRREKRTCGQNLLAKKAFIFASLSNDLLSSLKFLKCISPHNCFVKLEHGRFTTQYSFRTYIKLQLTRMPIIERRQQNTVEPPFATSSTKRPVIQNTNSYKVKSLYLKPLVSDHLL